VHIFTEHLQAWTGVGHPARHRLGTARCPARSGRFSAWVEYMREQTWAAAAATAMHRVGTGPCWFESR
jgi:hypothetical protein